MALVVEKYHAHRLGQKARIAKAIRHLEKAVNLYPNFLEAQMKLGTAYMDTKQWDKAEKALRRTLEIDPKTSNAFFALGEVYASEEKYSEAESILRKGFKLNEKSWHGHLALGHVYWDMGNWLKAGPEVGRALQLKPDSAEGHLLAGNILLKARQPQNALVEFEEYLRLAPAGEFAGQARGIASKLKTALAGSSDKQVQQTVAKPASARACWRGFLLQRQSALRMSRSSLAPRLLRWIRNRRIAYPREMAGAARSDARSPARLPRLRCGVCGVSHSACHFDPTFLVEYGYGNNRITAFRCKAYGGLEWTVRYGNRC